MHDSKSMNAAICSLIKVVGCRRIMDGNVHMQNIDQASNYYNADARAATNGQKTRLFSNEMRLYREER